MSGAFVPISKPASCNWRPIALISQLGKVFTTGIKRRLNYFCEATNMSPEEDGLKKRSNIMYQACLAEGDN